MGYVVESLARGQDHHLHLCRAMSGGTSVGCVCVWGGGVGIGFRVGVGGGGGRGGGRLCLMSAVLSPSAAHNTTGDGDIVFLH